MDSALEGCTPAGWRGRKQVLTLSTSQLGRAAGAHSVWVLKLRLQQVDPGRRLVPTG